MKYIYLILALTVFAWMPVHAEEVGFAPDLDVLHEDLGQATQLTADFVDPMPERSYNVTGEYAAPVTDTAQASGPVATCSGCHALIETGSVPFEVGWRA